MTDVGTILGQKLVMDLMLPVGEVRMHPFTQAAIEARASTVTTVFRLPVQVELGVRCFRKKPVVIEALQFTGDNCITILHWMGVPGWDNVMLHSTDAPVIHSLEGDLVASIGDWIIKGVKGEFYPCKPDIFEATYEAVQ